MMMNQNKKWYSIRFKIVLPIVVVSVIGLLITAVLVYRIISENIEENLQNRAESIVNVIKHFSEVSSGPEQVQQFVTVMKQEFKVDLIVAASGTPLHVFAASEPDWFHNEVSSLTEFPYKDRMVAAAGQNKRTGYGERIHKTYVYITTLNDISPVVSGINGEYGAILVAISLNEPYSQLPILFFNAMIVRVIFILIIVLFCLFIIYRVVIKPSKVILTTIDLRKAGDAGIRVPAGNLDEIGDLGRSLNEMFDELDRQTEMRNKAEQELKLSEANLRKINATKDTFFSIISHDLKSPFNGLLGLSQILSENFHKLTPDQRDEIVHYLHTNIVEVYKLVENLLEWSRVQMNQSTFDPEVIDLGLLALEVVTPLRINLEKKKQEIRMEIPPNTTIYADRHMIATVLRNLVSNAIKFSFEGGRIVIRTLTTPTGEIPAGYIAVAVTDEGMGIKQEDLAVLFQADLKIRHLGTSQERGTGLGLFLCREFITKHGGDIRAESVVGSGSTFTFTVPIRDPRTS